MEYPALGATAMGMAAGYAPAYPAPAPQQYAPTPAPPAGTPPPTTTPKKPRSPRGALLLCVAVMVAALAGGAVGAVVTNQLQHRDPSPGAAPSAPPAPSAEAIHAADVRLCTAYVTINAAMPKPQNSGMEVLPGVNGLRLALAENPNASREIRDAITDVVYNYDALIAAFGEVRTRGLAEPPKYDMDKSRRILDHAWDVCQLGN